MQESPHNPQFIVKTLPAAENHYDIWKKYKHAGENLYLVDIPMDEFIYMPHDVTIDSIVGYLTSGVFYTGNQCQRGSSPEWQRDYETYLKLVWLTESYLTDKLEFPIGGHWNPRLAKNVFHPGGARNVVLKLFHNSPIKTVYFNTGGIKFNWLNDQPSITIDELKKLYNCSIYFVLTADHGSLIPHVHFDINRIDNSIPEYHRRITSVLRNGIYTNYPFHEKFKKLSFRKNKDCPIRILFKKTPSLEDQIRALLMWPIDHKRIELGNILIEKDI